MRAAAEVAIRIDGKEVRKRTAPRTAVPGVTANDVFGVSTEWRPKQTYTIGFNAE